jgi:alpha-1,3-rhamnosyl/mannosyltransferase
MPPLIALDARTVEGQFTGIGRYTLSLFPLLVAARPGWRFHLFVTARGRPLFEGLPGNVVLEEVPPVPSHPASDFWQHVTLPRWLAANRAAVYFSAANYVPAFSGGARRVVTIHDLGPYRFPGLNPWRFDLYLKLNFRLCALVADAIVADSQAMADELESILGVARSRIHLAPLGVAPRFRRLDEAELSRLLSTRPEIAELPRGFILSVGEFNPRKNYDRLVAAYAGLRTEVPLVLAGPTGRARALAEQRATELGIRHRLRFLGYLDDDSLLALYNVAGCFIFPTIYEGFGLPVLEAMACATPVLCARTSSLPEVAGEAALMFEPTSEEAIAQAMRRFLDEPELGARLAKAGPPQAALFTWQKTAELTAKVLEAWL